MDRKNNEINRATAEMTGILKGINATMATIEFTPDGTIISANNNFLKAMKYSLDDIRGQHHRMFVPRDVLEAPDYKKFWSRLAAGESITGIFKRVSASGSTVWLNAIYNPIFNSDNKVIKVVKFATDITAEQEMLSESKGILRGINETMATIEFTSEGRIITANINFLKSIKYSLAEIQGNHHSMFVPPETRDSDDYKIFWRTLAKGEPVKGIFKRVDALGNFIWLNAIYNPIFNANKEVVKILKFATDITAEQERLAEGKGILEGINSSMATIEFTPTGTVLNANDNFLKLMKYTLEDIKGEHHKKFVPQEILQSPDYTAFWDRLGRGESITGIFQRVDGRGKNIWLNAIYNPIFNASHQVVKIIKFATNITNEQERLRRSA